MAPAGRVLAAGDGDGPRPKRALDYPVPLCWVHAKAFCMEIEKTFCMVDGKTFCMVDEKTFCSETPNFFAGARKTITRGYLGRAGPAPAAG